MLQADTSPDGAFSASARTRVLGVILLTVVAAIPRFHDLNRQSLAGDEDLTALAALSVMHGEGAKMPSGMPYLRALPFTWVNAGVASVLGEDREISYRITSAVFGTVTPAALFLTGAAFVPVSAAFVAGSMLALSRWHIQFSRRARMYAPFAFFFILAAYFMWKWAMEGGRRNGILAVTLFAVTVSLHLLGLIAAEFALIPLALRDRKGPSAIMVIGVALGAAAILYGLDDQIVGAPYRAWSLPRGFDLPGTGQGGGGGNDTGSLMALAAAGALAGAWFGWLALRRVREGGEAVDPPLLALAIVTAAGTTGAFVATGNLFGAALAIAVLLLLHPEPPWEVARQNRVGALLLVLAAVGWSGYAVSTMGLGDGISRIATYPFPYVYLLFEEFPGVIILFCVAAVWIALSLDRLQHPGLVATLLAVILPMAALGMMRAWGGTRYLLEIYPYILLVVGAVVVHFATRIVAVVSPMRERVGGLALSILLVLSGLMGGHGVLAAAGAMSEARADHRGTGHFVRDNLAAGDIVITEHPETQFFYAGQVDYWLRRAGDAEVYLYLGPDGVPRDEYASTLLLATVDDIEEALRSATGRVWLITSAETAPRRDYYLSDDQRLWLDSIEADLQPRFVGEDGVGKAYCLNCDK